MIHMHKKNIQTKKRDRKSTYNIEKINRTKMNKNGKLITKITQAVFYLQTDKWKMKKPRKKKESSRRKIFRENLYF